MRLLNKRPFVFAAAATIILLNGCYKKLDLLPSNAFVDNTAFTTPDRCLLAGAVC